MKAPEIGDVARIGENKEKNRSALRATSTEWSALSRPDPSVTTDLSKK